MGYDKNKLAELLKTIYSSTSEGSDAPEKYRQIQILGGSGTKISFATSKGTFEAAIPDGDVPTLKIVDDGVDALDAFADELLKDDDFRNAIGRSAIQERIGALLQSTRGLPPNEDLKDVVRFKIIKPLRDEIRPWCSYVPIVNLVVKTPLQLGDVWFVPQETAEQDSERFISDHRFGGIDAEEQEEQKQLILRDMRAASQQTKAFAKVSLRVHSNRVSDSAADKALIAVNILRSYTHLFYPYDNKALIGLPTEISIGRDHSVSLGQDERHTFDIKHGCRGTLVQFVLDNKKIEDLTLKYHLGLIQEILDKRSGERNPLETALVWAFQSLGCAIVAPTVDMRFLGCIIALERMLIRDHEPTTTERWTDRLAVLLGKDANHRQTIIKRAKGMYDLRSRIVHAGYSGASDADARLLEQWAIHVILSTLGRHKEYKSHEDFCKRIDPREIGLSADDNIQ